MSITSTAFIDCRCGARLEVLVADSLNAARHPHLKEALLQRRLHVFTCAACARPLTVEKELLYVDLERRQFVGLFPARERVRERQHGEALVRAFEQTMLEAAPAGVRALATNFLVRVAFGYEELREKIVADDAGLSDLLLEALKARLLLDEASFFAAGVMTLRLDRVLASGDLLFSPEWHDGFRPDDERGQPFVVERAVYEGLRSQEAALVADGRGLTSGPHCSVLRLIDWSGQAPA